MLRYDRLDLV